HGVERAHRVLEDHRDLAAADPLHLALALSEQILAVEQGLATHDPRRRPRDEAHEAQARHAIARAGFAHESERLGLAERKADAVHRLDRSPAGDDVSPKVANVDAGDQSWRSLGSRVSRSQSPRRLKASTTSRIASPGKSDTHQALVTKSRRSEERRVGKEGRPREPANHLKETASDDHSV